MRVEFNYNESRREIQIVSEFLGNIREAFSVKNQAAKYNRFSKWIPQRLYAITPQGYCAFGLVPDIIKYLDTLNIPFELVLSPEYIQIVNKVCVTTGIFHVRELNCELKLRDYQRDAIKAALVRGYGTIVVGTGGGKTFIMASLLNNLNSFGKTLIIVPDIGLVEQTYKDFVSYGIPDTFITKWTGNNELDTTKSIIIANLGILQSKISDISWFNQISVLVVDECHKLRRGNKINKLLDKIPTFNRFGFTGTLPENNIDKWNITGQLGPVVYEMSASELRAVGQGQFIADAHALAIKIEYNLKPDYTAVSVIGRYRLELDYIYNNPYRYKVIKSVVSKLANNCLILVDHIEHGVRMFNELSALTDREVYFIRGDVEVEARQKIQQIMEVQDNVVCIAISKIFSTGISIKNIHYIIFAAGGKSKIKTLQSIGRGLRVHKNKESLLLIDIVDNLVYGSKHYNKRKEFYALEKIQIQEKTIVET